MPPNDEANESQAASLTPTDWSFFSFFFRQGALENPIFCVLSFFFSVYSLVMSRVKEIFFFSTHFPASLSKSIIYRRYNTWMGQILSAWAPLLWPPLERGWKLPGGRNDFWGLWICCGIMISGELHIGRGKKYQSGLFLFAKNIKF